MKTINQLQDELIEEIAPLDDWMDRYEYIIDLGQSLEALAPEQHTPDNLIEGCQSRLWLDAQLVDGRLYYHADSDAMIVRGIVAMLIGVLNGHTPQEIAEADLYFIDSIGLREHLSPTRSNGLLSMLKQMRAYAVAYSV